MIDVVARIMGALQWSDGCDLWTPQVKLSDDECLCLQLDLRQDHVILVECVLESPIVSLLNGKALAHGFRKRVLLFGASTHLAVNKNIATAPVKAVKGFCKPLSRTRHDALKLSHVHENFDAVAITGGDRARGKETVICQHDRQRSMRAATICPNLEACNNEHG